MSYQSLIELAKIDCANPCEEHGCFKILDIHEMSQAGIVSPEAAREFHELVGECAVLRVLYPAEERNLAAIGDAAQTELLG